MAEAIWFASVHTAAVLELVSLRVYFEGARQQRAIHIV